MPKTTIDTMPDTMIAIRIENPGPDYRLLPSAVARPAPGRGEVLIRVAAAGVNRADIVLGQDISTLSEHELAHRIAALEAEIVRCREAIAARQATKAAADGFFKKA